MPGKLQPTRAGRGRAVPAEREVRGGSRALLPTLAVGAGVLLSVVDCGGGAGPSGSPASGSSSAASGEAVILPGAPSGVGAFGFGEVASAEAIARWDIDVGPDGAGLPPDGGTAEEGAEVYNTYCVACHGATGVEGPNTVLVSESGGPFPSGNVTGVPSTIGNYWPYATTVFDYTRRSMPFDRPGILTDAQVYSVTAWILWRNDLIAEDEVMDASSLPQVVMPAKEHFVTSEDVRLRSLP